MTQWIKVIRDLWSNRSRTILVILSITVGIFAIGMIAATQQALTESLRTQYLNLRPADGIIQTDPTLDDDFITSIRHMRGVDEAEGRCALSLRISLDGQGETWRDLTVYALADYADQRLFLVNPQDGVASPEKGEVLLERASMDYLGIQAGNRILVKTTDGRQFHLKVTGRAHDLYRIPPVIDGLIYGYIGIDTIRWMGLPTGYNELYLTVNPDSSPSVMVDKVANRIEGLGLPVYQKTLPNRGEHPLGYIIDTILILLSLLAVLSMLLSTLLVVNVVSALIAQQERQIGIMKAVGARSWQIMNLYFGMVVLLGLFACLIAIPFSYLGANMLASFVAKLINFNSPGVEFKFSTLFFQLGVGIIAPLIAATPAILNGTKISPARVLSEYGINQIWGGAGFLDSLINRFSRFSRDILLALRNPFRKRERLILSLGTLTFAGAVFMGIVNLRASLNTTLNQMVNFWSYDAWLVINNHISAERLVNEAKTISGVEQAEAWGFAIGRYIRPDGSESDNLYLLAPPAGTDLLVPTILAGRALHPRDKNAILVTPGFLSREPDLHLGSTISIKLDGREQPYTIVGVMNMMSSGSFGYMTVMNYADYTRHVREPNRSNAIILTLAPDNLDDQRRLASQIEHHYDRIGIQVLSNTLISEEREELNSAFGIIVALLMVMAILLATVGGLGLMGTMSLNVIERSREIGVMRAYGASSFAIFRIVIIEGLLIGSISWFLAIFLSLPLSVLLVRNIGESFMDFPMPASYSVGGILVWAILVSVISIIASVFPALRAVRLTVTEVLAYE
jgi:putative ABC transport system permease protein